MRNRIRRDAPGSAAALCLVLLTSSACASSAQEQADPNLELVRKFTSAWLVDKDLDLAKSYLSPDFFLLEGDRIDEKNKWPGPGDAPIFLKLVTECSVRCSTGEGCFFTLDDRQSSVWGRERIDVGDTQVAADARFSKFVGHELEVFSSRLLGCGHVVSLGVSSATNVPQTPRIAFIFLFSP